MILNCFDNNKSYVVGIIYSTNEFSKVCSSLVMCWNQISFTFRVLILIKVFHDNNIFDFQEFERIFMFLNKI